ncbi:single-stranded DNA-binding protein [Dialister invisus]|uniref:single-stranded DNA-binding protein n=1 Tax=Dialister invisus TaxID=218538 RepID=UPI0028D72144|nr:single-stranded DNA-binding protein [Dialister invisus]
MISATLYGRLARDPERMQPSNGGESYVRFSMAVETGRKDQDGNRIAQFINISVFGKQGDVIRQYFRKGNRIVCHVRNLEIRTYTDQSGQSRASLQAVLTGIEFVETKADQNQQEKNTGSFARFGTPQAAPAYGAATGTTPAPQTLPGMQTENPVPAPWDI